MVSIFSADWRNEILRAIASVAATASGALQKANNLSDVADPAKARKNIGADTLPGHLYGLTLANSAGDLTNDISVAVGSAADSAGVVRMVLSSLLTKRLDAAWAVGNNAGGRMSAAAIANTTYHVFLIYRADTGVVDLGFDTSATAPTLPANYTNFRRIGSIIRIGGAIQLFTQSGDVIQYAAYIVDFNSTANRADAPIALSVPTGIRVRPIILAIMSMSTAGNVAMMLDDGDATAARAYILAVKLALEDGRALFNGPFLTNTSAQLRFAQTVVSGAISLGLLWTFGYIDDRGKLA